jgi:hypothetical protein
LLTAGYSIAVPTVSLNTVVRTNIVLMNAEQAMLMDKSELKNANYYIASYASKSGAISYYLEQDGSYKTPIPSVSYFGNKSGICVGKKTFLSMNMQSTNRHENVVEATLDHYFSEVFYMADIPNNPLRHNGVKLKIDSGNELLIRIRKMYNKSRTDTYRIIEEINRRLENKGCFDRLLHNMRIPRIHDPYQRGDKGEILYDKRRRAKLNDYDAMKEYEAYRLQKILE